MTDESSEVQEIKEEINSVFSKSNTSGEDGLGVVKPAVLPQLKMPLEEYCKGQEKESTFQDLFEATKENVDLRTELTWEEITLINKLVVLNDIVKRKLGFDYFGGFIEHYLRLKVSKDRASRKEFVDINKKDRFDKHLQEFSNFSSLNKVKE